MPDELALASPLDDGSGSSVRALDDWRSQFFIDGDPVESDWNSREAFNAFVRNYPGKVPWLNTTKILTARDTYGMKSGRVLIPQRAATPGPRKKE